MAHATKKLLADSLKKLLEKKPLDKITVKEIVEECGVNRQTFYYNFQDIYDLMEWIFLEDSRVFLEDKVTVDTWQDRLIAIIAYMKENESLVMNAYRSISRSQLEKFLKMILYPIMKEIVEGQPQKLVLKEDDEDFVIRIYVLAMIGLTFEWLDSNMSENMLAYYDRLVKLFQGSLKYVIAKMSE